MARIAFLQWERVEWLGVMSLAAAARSHGHRCEVFVESVERDGSTHLLRLIDRAWRWVFSLHRRAVDGF